MDVTIIILNFNRRKFLERSLRSCLDQITANKKIEVLVVDDNSKDDSIKFLKRYKKQVTLIKNKKNHGVGYCSNLAVKKSKGKYFIRVDSDDYINKFTVEIMSEILDNNKELSFVYADHFRVDENSFKQKLVKIRNLKQLFLHGAGIMFKKNDVLSIGNYNKNLRGAEDHELIYRLIEENKKYFHLPLPFYRYYIHRNNLTNHQNRQKFIKKFNQINVKKSQNRQKDT